MIMKRNILLVTSGAPLQSPFSTSEKRPPIGIGFLISTLREAGHEVFFIDNYVQPSDFLETDYLERNEIDYVGIYANTICYRDTLRMLYKIEHMRRLGQWKGKIVVGGPQTTVAPDTIPEFVDFVVQGEGERAILEIVEGKVANRIVSYPRIKNLDELPMVAWDYFFHLPYNWEVEWFAEKPVFTLNTSRGCPFACSFCSVGSIWGKQYTFFSAERVVSDIEYLITKYGAKGIYFREDNFTVNKARVMNFCNLLLDKKIKIPWACESRVDTLNRNLVEIMHTAGVRAFYFGVESGSQRILDRLRKGISPDQIREAFSLCREKGIKTAASMIVGVPGETAEDMKQTQDLLEEIKPDLIWWNVFVGIPKGELYHYVLENKLYEFVDDRGLVYLKGHNDRVKKYYGGGWNAHIPVHMDNPQISVVMPAHNSAGTVREAIESILRQTFQDFEFIIIDDASTDDTGAIIQAFDDPRIRLIRNAENLGATKSLNKGMDVARGKYIARMDADDLSLPHRFETQFNFLENHPDYALVGSSYLQMDGKDNVISLVRVLLEDREIKEGLKKQNWFGHGSVMMRKSALQRVGGYDEKFIFAQDYDLWLRVAEKYKMANIDEPLYCWRLRDSGISKARQEEQRYYAALALSEAVKRSGKGVSSKSIGPKVSVILPTYNRPEKLVEAIKSVLEQSYQNFEIIVINDAGADVENIISFLNQRKNITYMKHSQNRGLAAARNSGIKVARGKYIAYLDDDDIYYPDHIESLVRFLQESDYKVVYTDAYRAHQIKENSRYTVTKRDLPYSFDFDCDRILLENFIPVLCFMHEKSCLDEVGFFDEELSTQEDWDLWVRLSRKYKFAHLPKVTCEFTWREDGTTMTSSQGIDFLKTKKRIYEKYRECSSGNDQIVRAREAFLKSFGDLEQRQYDKAQKLIEDGKIEEAIGTLEGLLRLSPMHSQAYDDLGALCYQKGENNRARECFLKSLEGDASNTNAMKNLGDLCLQMGNPVEALEFYRKILSTHPRDIDALLGVGNYCVQTGRIEEAKGFYKKVMKIEPGDTLAKRCLEALGNIPATPPVSGSTGDRDRLPVTEEKNAELCEKQAKKSRVSIVIPVYNNLNFTQACVRSIFQNTEGVDYEILIVDNGSTDGTSDYLKQMPRGKVTPIFGERNLGFVEATNLGAEAARGEYLLFLNNDTEVQPGWLTALLELAESTPDCGAVGSRLVYPNGRLQEAGGIIFADGNGWNFGRGMDPRDARFNFVREVDYCSGAALMVRKDLWTRIGGFDRRYSPAYYEDADLCFEIRRLGYKVYYQPKSVVIHHEGRTSGTDLQSGFKKFQEMNRPKFMQKWSEELSRQFPNDPKNIIRASQRNVTENILILDAYLPLFDRASGGLRLLNVLKCLRKMGFHVTFVAMNPFEAYRYVPILQESEIEVYAGDRLGLENFGFKVDCPNLDIAKILAERKYRGVVLSFWYLAEYYLPLIRKYSPQSEIIIDTVDIHFLRETREAKIKNSKSLEKQSMITRKREIDIYQKADRLWVVTEEDRKAIEGLVGKVPIDIIPNAHQKVEHDRKYEETSDLLFVGNFNHPPNLDAVQYFCQEVFPLILGDLPDIKLVLGGNNPPDKVKALATDKVTVTGYVEDLSPYLKRARISVNPLRFGAGMKGKIGEALSWGLPVVTTSIGAEGMGLVDGEEALIADSPGEFAAAIVRLYQEGDLWNRLSVNGKKKAEENWSLDSLQARLESIFLESPPMPPRDLVSIIILIHNQLAYTQKCLESIFIHTDTPFELILVDNGSTDGTGDYLKGVKEGNIEVGGWRLKVGEEDKVVWKKETPKGERRKGIGKRKKKRMEGSREKREPACQSFKIIHNETNQGFALGNNLGIHAAKGDYLLLLNNDVTVTPGWLRRMIACAEKEPKIGIVGPMSNYVSGPQLVQQVSYDTGTLAGLDRFAHLLAQKHAGQDQPFWRVVGFCMLIKRAVVEKIGGLDGRFGFGNFEDDDFSLRAQLAGFESRIARDCFVHHFGNRTFIGAQIDFGKSLRQNWELFKKKWAIPSSVAYGESYDLSHLLIEGFVPERHYCPLSPVEDLSKRGEELFAQGDLDGAKKTFEEILMVNPDEQEALNNMGVLAYHQENPDLAADYFNRALKADPTYLEAMVNLGNCLMKQKEFSQATACFKKALDRSPHDVSLLNDLANCFIQLEDFPEAEKIYERSYRLNENQNQVREALAALKKMKGLGISREVAL